MISNWLAASLARRNIHYGWVMVGVTFLTALISAGTVGAPGVFIVPLQREFGWTTAEISSALSIRFILFGLMAPFAAALLNRYGLRNVTLSALLVVVSGLVTSLAMTKIWHLMLLWGVVIGIGTGMTALVLGATIAARWFVARRGLVVGILTASVATGQLVFLPLLATLTDHYGWRVALGIFDFVGTIASGWLSDRYDNRYLLFWYYGLRGLSLLFLPFTDFSFYGLSLFAMFYGLDWIATVPPTVRLTAQRFGPERANLVFGWIFAGHQLGAGVAAFGAGLSRTVYATYLPAFFIAGALCIVAALIVLAISRPAKKPAVAVAATA